MRCFIIQVYNRGYQKGCQLMQRIDLSKLIDEDFKTRKPYKSSSEETFTAGPFENVTPCEVNDLSKEIGELVLDDGLKVNVTKVDLEEINANKRIYNATIAYSYKLSLVQKMKLNLMK